MSFHTPGAIIALGAVGLVAAAAEATAQPGEVWVNIDEVRLVTLKGPAHSFVVGNSYVADISVQDSNTVVVLGKTFGSTNVLVLNETGDVIENITIRVSTAQKGKLTLARGTAQASYSCAQRCERELMPGDQPEVFSLVEQQFSSKVDVATEAADQRQ